MSTRLVSADISVPSILRFPLHITLASSFTALLVLFGLALIGFNFKENRDVTLLAADDRVGRIAQEVSTNIASLYVPAQHLVDISSRTFTADAQSLAQRLESLGYLTEALRHNPSLASIYIGYDDGDFFLVRSLDERRTTAQVLMAPAQSRWVVQSVERDGAEGLIEKRLFFDSELRLLASGAPGRLGYDPRERPWYKAAIATDEPITSGFYVFFTTREVGVTFARRLAAGGGVVGADLNLSDFTDGLERQRVTPSTKIAVVTGDGGIIGLAGPGYEVKTTEDSGDDTLQLKRLTQLDDPPFAQLAERFGKDASGGRFTLRVQGQEWLASISPLPSRKGNGVYLAMLIPSDELLADVNRVRDQSVLISLGVLFVAVALVITIARQVSGPLRALAREARQIREFKLDGPIDVRSRIREVGELATTMALMKTSLKQFLDISHALSAEKDYARLMEMILGEARKVAGADGGAILMLADDEKALEPAIVTNARTGTYYGGTSGGEMPFSPVQLSDDESVQPSTGRYTADRHTAAQGEILNVPDVAADDRLDFFHVRQRFEQEGYAIQSLLSLPLRDQKGETIGILQLVNARQASGEIGSFAPEIVTYIAALASDAAVALDVRRLLKAQKDLMESFIQVIAGAIDAKSPYTHGHCQRVPLLARLLSEAAHQADEGPLKDFRLSDDEWYELYMASWLHDCGKVTIPEYVVDKATKLETIYNRIHEIRTRFEVLLRDAQIAYWKGLAEGTQEEAELRQVRDARIEQIKKDFTFVAECNIGGEFMSEERIGRIEEIATQTWVRHLDDRLGVSFEELQRKQREPAPELPTTESVLADKPDQIVLRQPGRQPLGDGQHGFRMDVPEHEYNYGEVYNLCIKKGTLTAEERFKINEHIVQTIIMLENLPFPRELRRVPDWAGNHHEKMDGTGYPRRLSGEEMSIPERIMAIADVFEALTAVDRPYKSGKTLSESLRIMSAMRNEGHIDPELFELFVKSGVYLQYAKEFMQPEQIDEVDMAQVVRGAS